MTQDGFTTGDDHTTIYPSRRLLLLYNIYLLIIVWFFVIPCLILLIIFIEPVTRIYISISALIIALTAIVLIRRSCESRSYRFQKAELVIRGGILSGRSVTVPYTGIRSVEIVRHRLPAYLGIASVRVIYTIPSGDIHRIYLDGIEDPESLRSRILGLAGGTTG
jgi:membrane protein YdbS with pleckstrin-like domain